MKIKHDFVTNSSSSSFIVAFDKKPTLKYLKKKIMFIEKAKQVWVDCKDQKNRKLTPDNTKLIEQIISNITEGCYPEYREYEITEDEFLRNHAIVLPEGKRLWEDKDIFEQYENENRKSCYNGGLKVAKAFIRNNMEKYIYFFTYADDDGRFFAEMEHGGTFDEMEHIILSNH